MAAITTEQLSQLPQEMLRFTIQKATKEIGPRLGTFTLASRKPINVPNFLGNTSRGVVPHLTQDNFRKNTTLKGVYVALEDFIERAPQQIPSVYQFNPPNGESPLRRFIALPNDSLLVLGARRIQPVACPGSNTNNAIQIYTSVGFRQLACHNYTSAAKHLKPDIVVALGDIPPNTTPSRRRAEKMADRTEDWVKDMILGQSGYDKTTKDQAYNIFAPILPISREQQTWYLNQLVDDKKDKISGLAIYDAHSLSELPKELIDLPRLSFDPPANPNRILYQVSLGMDLLMVPFVSTTTDAGIALNFKFAAPSPSTEGLKQMPLGVDMWSTTHAADMSPLSPACLCYACKNHSRAYLQHLLAAKEMLGWVLLQIHNHHILHEFFSDIRVSIEKGTFEEDRKKFEQIYEPDLPEQTGQGPRVRGYQFKSEGPGEQKRNPAPYNKLHDKANSDMIEIPETSTPHPNAEVSDIEKRGFVEAKR